MDPTPADLDRHVGRVRMLLAVLLALAMLIGGVAALIYVFRDPLPVLNEAALTAAETRWNTAGPRNYDLDLKLGGAAPGEIHIEVRGGQVLAMTRDGKTPQQQRTWDVWSVDGQFDTMHRELELAADPQGQIQAEADTRLVLRAEFDPQYGYPLRYRRVVLGGEVPQISWEVVRFNIIQR